MNTNDRSKPDYDADAAVRQATARIGGLSTWGRVPTEDERNTALSALAVARIDREIRQQMAKAPAPDPVETAHLVGLLLMWGGSRDGQAVERLERAVREAFYCTPNVTDADREHIAGQIVGG